MSGKRKQKSYKPLVIFMLITIIAVLGIAYYVFKDDVYFLQKKSQSPDKKIMLYIKEIQIDGRDGYRVSQKVDDNRMMYYEWTTPGIEIIWAPDSTKCVILYESSSGQVAEVLECYQDKLVQASAISSLSLRYYMEEQGYELFDEIPINMHFTGWKDENQMMYSFDTENTSGVKISGQCITDYSDNFKVISFQKDQ